MFFYNYYIYFVSSASAISCWDCDSISDPKCADPFDNTTAKATDCDHYLTQDNYLPEIPATMCRKIRMKSKL